MTNAMIESKKFQRTIEDFNCEHCGFFVAGTGYTNHCPQCLWSKHVDVNPGDRAASCGGLMEPFSISKSGDEFKVMQKCAKCGFERANRLQKGDNFDAAVALMQEKNSPEQL